MDNDEGTGGGKRPEDAHVSDRLSEATSTETLEEIDDSVTEKSSAGDKSPASPAPSPDGQFDDMGKPRDMDPFLDGL